MTTLTQTGQFSLHDFFKIPDLDIYQQMICIVLSALTSDKSVGTLSISEIASHGRMTSKQATSALQALVDKKILTHKAFREIVGDFGDDRLSWMAKGLLVFLKQHPRITFEELVELSGQSEDQEHALREGLNDLRRFGYLDELSDDAALLTG